MAKTIKLSEVASASISKMQSLFGVSSGAVASTPLGGLMTNIPTVINSPKEAKGKGTGVYYIGSTPVAEDFPVGFTNPYGSVLLHFEFGGTTRANILLYSWGAKAYTSHHVFSKEDPDAMTPWHEVNTTEVVNALSGGGVI